MHAYVGMRGAGLLFGVSACLLAVLLAPLVIGALVVAAALLAVSAALGASGGRSLGRAAGPLIGAGKAVAIAIPVGLLVAFFGHESPTAVAVGFYTALGAVPLSIALIAAGIYAEG